MERIEVYEPPTIETQGGLSDLKSASRELLYSQRILRLAFTRPGDIHHRPNLGAGLQDFVGKIAHPETLRKIKFRFEVLLDALPFVLSYSFKVSTGDTSNARIIDIRVKSDVGDLTIPEIGFDNP